MKNLLSSQMMNFAKLYQFCMLGEDLEGGGDVLRILGPWLDSHLTHMAFHSQDNPLLSL
jgi:hypothetical protein